MRNLIIILAFILLISCSSRDKINKTPVADLNIAQLSAAYEKDEKAADSLYEGKTVLISGIVMNAAVIRETKGISLGSENSNSDWVMICLINKSDFPETYSIDFKVGEKVKFIGTVRRIEDRKFIHIADCHFPQ